MKGISLWQPHASAMACGSKRFETRHWPTKVRGRVAIHAAKRCVKDELYRYGSSWNWIGALSPIGAKFGNDFDITVAVPFGAIVAVGDLIDCVATDMLTQGDLDTPRTPDRKNGHLYVFTERQMGNYELGRYAWIFENIVALKTPIPFKAKQGFFHIPDELFPEVSA